MVSFYELRRGSSTLLRKAACGVPVFIGVQGFESYPMGKPTGTPIYSFCMRHLRHNKKRHLKRCLFC